MCIYTFRQLLLLDFTDAVILCPECSTFQIFEPCVIFSAFFQDNAVFAIADQLLSVFLRLHLSRCILGPDERGCEIVYGRYVINVARLQPFVSDVAGADFDSLVVVRECGYVRIPGQCR